MIVKIVYRINVENSFLNAVDYDYLKQYLNDLDILILYKISKSQI